MRETPVFKVYKTSKFWPFFRRIKFYGRHYYKFGGFFIEVRWFPKHLTKDW